MSDEIYEVKEGNEDIDGKEDKEDSQKFARTGRLRIIEGKAKTAISMDDLKV